MTRPSWDDYWSDMAALVATRSTCPRAHVGAVLVKFQRVIATGYNGSPPGEPHCEDVGCAVLYEHCKRTTHAEVNALTNALLPAIGATLYVTKTPCGDCRRALSDAGVMDIRLATLRAATPAAARVDTARSKDGCESQILAGVEAETSTASDGSLSGGASLSVGERRSGLEPRSAKAQTRVSGSGGGH